MKDSSREADSYEDAMHLLENLRITRLARVRRRHDVQNVPDLLKRLERLPQWTVDLASQRFPTAAEFFPPQRSSSWANNLLGPPQVRYSQQFPSTLFSPDIDKLNLIAESSHRETERYPTNSRQTTDNRASIANPIAQSTALSFRSSALSSTLSSSSNIHFHANPEGSGLPPLPPLSNSSIYRSTSPSSYAFNSFSQPRRASPPLSTGGSLSQHLYSNIEQQSFQPEQPRIRSRVLSFNGR